MAVVIANNLKKELAGNLLFDGVSLKVERRERLPLSGPHGAGKTTLLRMLAGQTEIHGGELAFQKGTRVALHDQRPPLELGLTLREYAFSGASDVIAAEEELTRLEQAMAAGDHEPATITRYGEAQALLEHAGGYAWRERAMASLRGLGFADDDVDRPLATFSGGELTRASLARSLTGGPDLLLLDEPTNHLDVERLEWLERELQTMDAAVILVAHDRWFLEAVTTSVLELDGGRALTFKGSWHNWRRERAARMIHAEKEADRIAVDIARLDRFVERFRYKKDKAKQAQAKLTQIQRLKQERSTHTAEIDRLTVKRRTLGFEFLKPKRSGRVVIEVDDLAVSAGDKALLHDVAFALERGEPVGLVGPNGAGKTTLLETLLDAEHANGRVRFGHGVEPAYFSQQEMELDTRGTVLQCVQRATGLLRPDAQNLLGRFLFSGWDEQTKPVAVLSGGERRRLALALVVASGANLLVLDEPTNHLDLESREALEAALDAFPGTVLLVSHDRALLDAVAERMLAIEDYRVVSYPGGWADYVVAQQAADEEPAPPPPPKKPKPRPRQERPPEPSALELVEREVARAEERLAGLERELAADWSDMALLSAHRAARQDLEALLARWESLFEEVGS